EPEPPAVDIQQVSGFDTEMSHLLGLLKSDGMSVELHDADACHQRLRTGKTALYVVPDRASFRYVYDPSRPESVLARYRVDAVIERWKAAVAEEGKPNDTKGGSSEIIRERKARGASWRTVDSLVKEPGNRYIDFLMPGLIGMNLMGGGLWGVGFVIVDMRVRKLLKRLLATPMKRYHYLLAILLARLVMLLPEMLLLILAGRFIFGVPLRGGLLTLALVVLAGASAFSRIGLLIASRTEQTETLSRLMNPV